MGGHLPSSAIRFVMLHSPESVKTHLRADLI